MVYVFCGCVIIFGIGLIRVQKSVDKNAEYVVKAHDNIAEQGKVMVEMQQEIIDLYDDIKELKSKLHLDDIEVEE